MRSAWQHPSLGNFERKDSVCFTTLTVPAFKKFSYDTGYSNAPRSTGKVRLSLGPFLFNERMDEPTPEMVQIAEKILADPEKLVRLVAEGLWEDFNGRGPTGKMWWYGEMDVVSESFQAAHLPSPKRPEEILPALQLTDIDIFPHLWKYAHAVAVLTFHAAFEEEHGLCIVTDGERFLGAGCAGEPEVGEGSE